MAIEWPGEPLLVSDGTGEQPWTPQYSATQISPFPPRAIRIKRIRARERNLGQYELAARVLTHPDAIEPLVGMVVEAAPQKDNLPESTYDLRPIRLATDALALASRMGSQGPPHVVLRWRADSATLENYDLYDVVDRTPIAEPFADQLLPPGVEAYLRSYFQAEHTEEDRAGWFERPLARRIEGPDGDPPRWAHVHGHAPFQRLRSGGNLGRSWGP